MKHYITISKHKMPFDDQIQIQFRSFFYFFQKKHRKKYCEKEIVQFSQLYSIPISLPLLGGAFLIMKIDLI